MGDVLRGEARILKLAPHNSRQVKPPLVLLCGIRGRLGIAGFLGAGEEILCLRKFQVERIENLFSDFVTTCLDAGTEDRNHFARRCSVACNQLARSLFDDANQSPSPACMNGCHGRPLRVEQQNRDTIRRTNRKKDSGFRGRQRISCRPVVEIDPVLIRAARRVGREL